MSDLRNYIDQLKQIEGYPIASINAIEALSDVPQYTACPNPFIHDFIARFGTPYDEATDTYKCEPYTDDVSEDKHDLIYNIHSYHTKVPPKAIRHYIEHYTKPGDIVLDSFCGTGMAGVAAQTCKDKSGKNAQRLPILIDLSSIASFIAANYNKPLSPRDISVISDAIETIKQQYGEDYQTDHIIDGKPVMGFSGPITGIINYVVWSDVFICPNCSHEFVFYDVAVDSNNRTQKEFPCPKCSMLLSKAKSLRAVTYAIDEESGKSLEITKSVPVLINYSVGTKRFNKRPDEKDLLKLEKFNVAPRNLPIAGYEIESGDKTTELLRGNVREVKQLYRGRTLHVINSYYQAICGNSKAMFLLTSALPKLTILNRFMPEHGSRALVGPMAGTFYLPAMSVENNAIHQLEFQFKKLKNLVYDGIDHIVSMQSATDLSNIPPNAIDYVFIDPPFGANIMYSELNSVSESWLRVKTNNKEEAIINDSQKKSLVDYQGLMTKAFAELYRVLKPNRWITVEFHNSKNAVWNSIQEALSIAGFVIADVRLLNKEKKTINQFNARGAVDQDLIISAYKPLESFQKELMSAAGNEETAWAFVRQHLEKLAVVSIKDGRIEIQSERQAILLFDRMVAYHIMRGIPVPIDSIDFYRKLDEKFLKRDGMYFLPDQVNEYDTARIVNDVEPIQFSFIVSNEKTAISWLYQQLDTPQTYAEIQPKFMQEIKTVDKFEAMPELAVLLEENFLQDEKGRWYIPDVTKEADVAKLREKNLLKEFEGYLATKGKLKLFRAEAVRVGFAKLWKDKNYKLIVETAERLPEQIIQEDDKLLMYYDISLGRI